MDLTDALRIPLGRSAVTEALRDGALLRASIENCESFARHPSGEYRLVVTVPVGTLRGRYEIRVHAANRDRGATPANGEQADDAMPRSHTLSFKASAPGIGCLRGQIDVELADDALVANEDECSESVERPELAKGAPQPPNSPMPQSSNLSIPGGDFLRGVPQGDFLRGAPQGDFLRGATRIQYEIWAALTGPLAELAPGLAEDALHAIAKNFFAEFSAVVVAKYGKGPNRARTSHEPRQHVFLRPISVAGAARRPAAHESLETGTRRLRNALAGRRGAPGFDRRTPQILGAWAWTAAFACGVALLYVLRRLAQGA
jgi:carbon monoxide dehydrogenase subunit G